MNPYENKYSLNRNKVIFKKINENESLIFWQDKSVEERFDAIEFLRHQYMEMMGIEPVMDRKHFEYRKG
ncbi:MAG: hypothetical protein JKY53_07265 [Flavobacteriales bacterium]|nr:hypothetical protein [Flavobacteriales bacterium]